jgi:hypothetical protein
MRSKIHDLLTWQSEANLSLFLFLLILTGFVLPSVGFEKNSLQLYDDVTFSVVSLVGVVITWGNRRLFVLASLIATFAILLRWATWWKPTNTVILWSTSAGLVALLMITAVLLWQVFRSGPVTGMRIQGAIAAYLCIGYSWAHAYHIAALLNPGAFNAAGSNVSLASTWVNYSFGMLTTIGYSGIVPVHPLAHTLGSTEALTGQLYLAVLVARLVSLQVSTAENRSDR